MLILNFLLANWSSVLLVLALIIAFIVLYIRGEKKIIYKILLFLITEAEKIYGSGTGELKLSYVISKIYDKMPKILKLVISLPQLVKWIEEALDYAKIIWAQNAAIDKYVSGDIVTMYELNHEFTGTGCDLEGEDDSSIE